MKHFLLFYEAGPDYLARRPAYRDAHLEKAWAASERGELVLGGALADPVDGAVLLFRPKRARWSRPSPRPIRTSSRAW